MTDTSGLEASFGRIPPAGAATGATSGVAVAADGPPFRVLIVDYSIGFGGATKSIGLVSHALAGPTLTFVTSQEAAETARWFSGFRVVPFRRVINYQSLERLRSAAPRGLLGFLYLKSVALLSLAGTWWSALRLFRELRRHPVDLIHLNNGLFPDEVLWAARAAGIPCVAHMRGFMLPEMIRKSSTGVRAIIAVSRSIADEVRAGGFPAEHTPVVWDPVDLEAIDRAAPRRDTVRAQLGIADGEIAVGLFGRVVRWKGTREFALAALRVLEAGGRIRPVIVGDVSDGTIAYMREVRDLVAQSAFADRFVFAGYQPAPEGHYHAMDIVVHASIEREPFGMVVPEGMAAGKPVIAAAAGGPLDIVDHEVDGLLTTPGDVMELAAAIGRLAGDPGLRARMGASGRAKARARFSVSMAADGLMRVWRETLALGVPFTPPLPRRVAELVSLTTLLGSL